MFEQLGARMFTIRQIVFNVFTGWTSLVIRAALALILVPFLISVMGKEGYGLIGLLSVMLSMTSAADLGLRQALGRHMTEALTVGDTRRLNELISTSLATSLAIAGGFALLHVMLAPWVVAFFKVPTDLRCEAITALRIYASFGVILAFIHPVFSAVLTGQNRFDLVNCVQVVQFAVSALLLLFLLPWIPSPLFGWVAIMLFTQVVAVAALALYIQGNQQHLKNILLHGTKFTFLLGSAACTIMLVFANDFCRLWLYNSVAEDDRLAAQVLQLWAVATFLMYLGGTQWALGIGMNPLAFFARIYLPVAVLNIALSIYFVGFTGLGITGAIMGTIVCELFRRMFIFGHFTRLLDIPFWKGARTAYGAGFFVFFSLLLSAYAVRYLIPVQSWTTLVCTALGVGGVWLILSASIGLTTYERSVLQASVRRFAVLKRN